MTLEQETMMIGFSMLLLAVGLANAILIATLHIRLDKLESEARNTK